MKRKDLMELAQLSTSTIAKMGKDQPVSMDVIIRICHSLQCNVGDIMDVLPSGGHQNQFASVPHI